MNKKVFIIAEAGVNHNGKIDLAKKLVDAASAAGADAVKFQTFKTERIVCRGAGKADYQKRTTGSTESQFEMIKKLELSTDAHKELLNYCQSKNIEFLSSPFDLESIDLLCELGLETMKIPSGEITNLPYLRKIGKLNKQIIISSGMADLREIKDALDVLVMSGTPLDRITVLHCNTEYPTPMIDVNLRAMETISSAFGVKIGYSDHTISTEISIAAVTLGATVIEKHFTLDKNMPGPDHQASLDPHELQMLVQAIRNVEIALGSGIKKPSTSELKNRPVARKSIVAHIPIMKGEFFTEKNITVKRPGTGINPMEWDKVINRQAPKDFDKDEMIEL